MSAVYRIRSLARTSLVFTCVVLVATTSVAHASEAEAVRLETRAFEALDAKQYCDAARGFVQANLAAPALDLVFNAAVAASMAHDRLLARRLIDVVGKKSKDPKIQAMVQEFGRAAAQGPGAYCPQMPLALDDKASLRRQFDDLETRLLLLQKSSNPATATAQTAAFDIPRGESAVAGVEQGEIEVVIYTDYQCPFCARLHPLVGELLQDERTKNRTTVVYKQFPLAFHKQARPAAIAALAAREQGPDAFWKFNDKLFESQRELGEEQFSAIAHQLGLDVRRFEKDLRQHRQQYENEIDGDVMFGKETLGVRGTPTIFVNGWRLGASRTVEGVVGLAEENPRGAAAASSPFRRVRTRGK